MKRSASKFIGVALVFVLALGLTFSFASPALANSASTVWRGVTSTGITFVGEGSSPIVVDSELLTFDIMHEGSRDYYDGVQLNTVTARYTFRNPTDDEITVRAVFPFMEGSSYYDYDSVSDGKFYDITVDGVSVNSTVRATYYNGRYGGFDLEKEIANVTDEYKTADGWDLSEKVYRYKLQIDNDFSGKMPDYSSAYVTFSLPNVKMFCSENVSARNEYYLGNNSYISISYNEATQFIEFYTVGEPLAVAEIVENAEFVYYKAARNYPRVSGFSVKIAEQNELTFEDLVYLYHTEDSKISRLDWHNIIFEKHHRFIYYGKSELSAFEVSPSEIRRWYDYEMTFAPKQTLVNEVKSPLFPDVDSGYDPTIFTYNYLLSPASTWASFKDLTIVVNTPFHILDLKDGWQKTETGYVVHYDTLPEYGELEMTVCSSEKPKHNDPYRALALYLGFLFGSSYFAIMLTVIPTIGLIAFAVAFAIKYLKSLKNSKQIT